MKLWPQREADFVPPPSDYHARNFTSLTSYAFMTCCLNTETIKFILRNDRLSLSESCGATSAEEATEMNLLEFVKCPYRDSNP
jgi:hypothetical protein